MTDQRAGMRDHLVVQQEVFNLGMGGWRVQGRGGKGGRHRWPVQGTGTGEWDRRLVHPLQGASVERHGGWNAGLGSGTGERMQCGQPAGSGGSEAKAAAAGGLRRVATSAPAGGLWRAAATSADPQRRESRFWDWPWIDVIRVKGGGAMVGLAAGQFCRRVLSQFVGWTKRHACKTRTTKLVAENGGSSPF
jgi:hypothetical protein